MTARTAFALLIAATVFFGCSTATADRALDGMSAFDLLFVELLAGTAVLWVTTLLRHGPTVAPRRAYALLGLLEPALAFIAFNLGLARTSAAAGSLLMGTESLFIVILAVLFLRERVARITLAALGLGLAGGAIVALGQPGGEVTVAGNALVVLGAVLAAGYGVMARRVAGRAPAVAVTAWQFLFGSLMVMPVVAADWAAHGSRLGAAGAATWAWALFSGVGAAAGFLLYLTAIDRLQASTAGVVLNLVPLVGLVTAVMVFGERPGPGQLAGGVVILAGLALLARAESSGTPVRAVEPAPVPSVP